LVVLFLMRNPWETIPTIGKVTLGPLPIIQIKTKSRPWDIPEKNNFQKLELISYQKNISAA